MGAPLYISVDLGAGSGRVFLVSFESDRLLLDEIRRFHYPPREIDGRLSWDFELIFENVSLGVEAASERGGDGEIVSVGVDSWAVDYGLLNADGDLISDPACYRDRRTEGVPDTVFELIKKSEIFERTGIQFLDFNSLYQLYSDRDRLPQAETFLLLPDLINYRLTGSIAAEFTNATTTQMLNVQSRNWDDKILERVEIDRSILPEIVDAGTVRGSLPGSKTRVVSVASHDTASAVAAATLGPTSAYISSGTWSLVGVELPMPIVNENVLEANFTNEGGAFGTTRFLKNVMGMWLLERCRQEWNAAGFETSYAELIDAAFDIKESQGLIFPDDPRFVNPPSMIAAIRGQLDETGQDVAEDPASIARLIFDSLAFRYSLVLKTASQLTGIEITQIEMLGGGGRNRYLNQMTANVTGLSVRSGLYEATVVGNALVQAIAAGQFAGVSEARKHVEATTEFSTFTPIALNNNLADRYSEIEERYR